VTYWNTGIQSTAGFNVLVVASNDGHWGTAPNYTALDSAGLSFDPTSQRVEVTGADVDWHLTSDINPVAPIDVTNVQTFLTNSVNWAGGGTGLGLVALGMSGNVGDPNFKFTGYTTTSVSTNSIGALSSPINAGLTDAQLSTWKDSSHVDFSIQDTTTWTGVDTDTDKTHTAGQFTTLISNPVSTTTGGTGVPEPTSLITLAGLATFVAIRRRKAA